MVFEAFAMVKNHCGWNFHIFKSRSISQITQRTEKLWIYQGKRVEFSRTLLISHEHDEFSRKCTVLEWKAFETISIMMYYLQVN